MLLNLNHKTLTAEKLILEKKKKSSTRKKKQLSIMQRNVHVLRHTLWNIVEHYFAQFETLENVVGTLLQYVLDEDTFN